MYVMAMLGESSASIATIELSRSTPCHLARVSEIVDPDQFPFSE
jgi:hypothetical protein